MAILVPFPKFYATDENGEPLVGGKLFTYEAGTTTKRDTYTDASGGVANANPVILDSSGLANVWIDPAYFYKYVLSPSTDTDPPTDPIWTVDDIGITTPEGLKGLTFVSETGSVTDSDPGAGKFKWNNATQSSATVLYFDDLTSDAVSLTTFWASLAGSGFLYMQQSDDSPAWQVWKWTAFPDDGTGYRKFTVTLQAYAGAIADNKSVLVQFTSSPNDVLITGTFAQYALYSSSSSYSRVAIKVATTTLASVSGASVTATSLIPARANVLGVNTKVTVALGTGSGTSGYQVGDGSDADLWGTVTGTATTTSTDGNNATANPMGTWSASARNVVLTANGGNFNGTGSVRIDTFYWLTEAD